MIYDAIADPNLRLIVNDGYNCIGMSLLFSDTFKYFRLFSVLSLLKRIDYCNLGHLILSSGYLAASETKHSLANHLIA
jgi:hypothetical protein